MLSGVISYRVVGGRYLQRLNKLHLYYCTILIDERSGGILRGLLVLAIRLIVAEIE